MARAWIDTTDDSSCAWTGLPPGPQLAAALAAADLGSLTGAARVSYLQAAARLEAWAQVLTAKAMVAVSDAVTHACKDPERWYNENTVAWISEEIAAALHVAPSTATHRLLAAEQLVVTFPVLGTLVELGELTMAQARSISEPLWPVRMTVHADGTPLADLALAQILPRAPQLPPARLRELAEKTVVALDPQGVMERRRSTRRDRTEVSVWRDAEGLATLAMRSLAPDALAIKAMVDRRAEQLRQQAGDGDHRTMGELRVMALMERFGLQPVAAVADDSTAGGGSEDAGTLLPAWPTPVPGPVPPPEPIHAQVHVVVDMPTLAGLADHPAHLDGYGPLDADLARALASDADWQRWVTDPVTGHLLDDGDRRYPGARLARFIRARDARCSHPSCSTRPPRSDVDHIPEFRQSGHTHAAGLTCTCPKHNRQRDAAGWTANAEPVEGQPPETTWRSPLGRTYRTDNTTDNAPDPPPPF